MPSRLSLRLITGLVLLAATRGALAGDGLSVAESTGSLHYEYRFDLPPARGRYQPDLALRFGGPMDYKWSNGWEVVRGIGRVSPVPTDAGYRYYTDGRQPRRALVASPRDGAGHFALDVEQSYMDFWSIDAKPAAKDAAGNIYTWGTVASGGQDQVCDPENNCTVFEPDRTIRYNGYNPAGPPGARAPTTGPFATWVTVEYATVPGVTVDPYQLSTVKVYNQGSNGPVVVRSYQVTYTTYTGTIETTLGPVYKTVPLVQSVTERGEGGTGLGRVTTFEYQQDRIAAVTSPLGVRRDVTWQSSYVYTGTFDSMYPMVSQIRTAGPGMVPGYVNYFYRGNPVDGTPWFGTSTIDPSYESSGFAESWMTDSASGIVRHTWWERAHAFLGSEAKVEYGTLVAAGPPPTYAVFRTLTYQNVARPITAAGTPGTCPAPGAEVPFPGPAGVSYPVSTFRQLEQEIRTVDGLPLASGKAVACGDVDSWGNVTKTTIDPDANFPGDEYLEQVEYEVQSSPAASCKDCVRERKKTDQTGAVLFEATKYTYGPTFLPAEVHRRPDITSWQRVTKWTYNADGTLASQVDGADGAVTTSYTYDIFQLRPATVAVADANSTLVTGTLYDDYGRPSAITGPYVAGRTEPAPQKHFTYDSLGRIRIVARQPIAGSVAASAIAAYEYVDFSGSTPASVRSYDFAVPLTFTSQWTPAAGTDPGIPQTPDARNTISYLDGLGREIQVRLRLGGTGTSSAGAGITRNLSGYRVAKAVLLDGAGRVTAAVEPYFSIGSGYQDLTAGIDASAGPVRAVLTTYDAQGRVTCSVTRAVDLTASPPRLPSAGSCASSFAESASYARATATSYRGTSAGGRSYLAVKTIPPENAVAGSMRGPESFYDAAGLLRWTIDAEGNVTRLSYDLIGRPTGSSREVPASPAGRPTSIPITNVPDLMGRVTLRHDPNIGSRSYVYDPVNPGLLFKIVFDKTGDEIRYTYDKGRTHTVTRCKGPGNALVCPSSPDETLSYDVPYAASYQYTAGRIASAVSATTAIAFGYDTNGVMVRRDQWLPGIVGSFSVTETVRQDGQSVQSDFASPVSSLGYATSYDSAGHPVQVASAAATYWAASGGSATTGAYDAMGNLAAASLDGGLVQESWTYGAVSALPLGHVVNLSGVPIYQVDQLSWRGTKLAGFTDSVGQTSHQYWYSNAGRLTAARALPPSGTNPLAQNSLVCLSYNLFKKYEQGASFGNVERTREGAAVAPMSPATRDYLYTNSNVETTGLPAPHAGGPDAAASIGASAFGYDDYGRVVSAAGGAEQFGYDLSGRMLSITRPAGTSEALSYDALGVLVSRQIGNKVIWYLGRATVTGTLKAGCSTAACGIDPASLQVDVHVTAGRRLASVRTGPGLPARTLYYYRDRLGSVVVTTISGGFPGASYRYSAHGALEVATGDSGDAASEIGYTGALRLSGGLLALGARAYNPAQKTFLQPDPLEPYKYDYAGGDPVNRYDPSGMQVQDTSPSSTFPFPAGGYMNNLNSSLGFSDTQYTFDIVWTVSSKIGDGPTTTTISRTGPYGLSRALGSTQGGISSLALSADRSSGATGTNGGEGEQARGFLQRVKEWFGVGPAKYVDLNLCFGRLYGVTAGAVFSYETGSLHLYGGVGLMSGPGVAVTFSNQSVTPGWNVGAQGGYGGAVVQKGLAPDGTTFLEGGFGTPGVAVTGYWIDPVPVFDFGPMPPTQ